MAVQDVLVAADQTAVDGAPVALGGGRDPRLAHGDANGGVGQQVLDLVGDVGDVVGACNEPVHSVIHQIAGTAAAQREAREGAGDVRDGFERAANLGREDGFVTQTLDGIETGVDRGGFAQRRREPASEEAHPMQR